MRLPVNSLTEFATIGTTPQTVSVPEKGPCQILMLDVRVPSTQPLKGAASLATLVHELESDSDMAARLAIARQEMAAKLDVAVTMRRLRLSAGLSQAKLADAAKTTQTYIARIEAGTLDPGTDMIARLAAGLGVGAEAVFAAVRTQREGLGLKP